MSDSDVSTQVRKLLDDLAFTAPELWAEKVTRWASGT